MKWSLSSITAFCALAAASPVAVTEEYASLERRATYNELANFDGLPTNAAVPAIHKHLSWAGLTVQSTTSGGHTRKLTPFSSPNYAVTNPGQAQTGADAPVMTITNTTTTSFDFIEFYYACLDARPGQNQVAVKCQFTVQAYNAFDTRHQGPILVTYTPGSGTGNKVMVRQPTGFSNVRSAYWLLYTSDAGLANTILVFDSVKYTAYTP